MSEIPTTRERAEMMLEEVWTNAHREAARILASRLREGSTLMSKQALYFYLDRKDEDAALLREAALLLDSEADRVMPFVSNMPTSIPPVPALPEPAEART